MAKARSVFTGTVKDPIGSGYPGRDCRGYQRRHGPTRDVTTSTAGVFNVPNLDLGSYKVGSPPGFFHVRAHRLAPDG